MSLNQTGLGNTIVLAQLIKEEIKREIMDDLRALQGPSLAPEFHPEMVNVTRGKYVPYAGKTGEILSNEPHTVFYADQETVPGWKEYLAADQGKGILYGIGSALLLGLFLPSLGRKMQVILNRVASEGIELIEKARSITARAKEDLEDLMAEVNLEKMMEKPRQ